MQFLTQNLTYILPPLIPLIIVSLLLILGKILGIKPIGKTEGICEKVDVEVKKEIQYRQDHNNIYYWRKYYIPYIRYNWEGTTYIGKSIRKYHTGMYFPGDKVIVFVNRNDKTIVEIDD